MTAVNAEAQCVNPEDAGSVVLPKRFVVSLRRNDGDQLVEVTTAHPDVDPIIMARGQIALRQWFEDAESKWSFEQHWDSVVKSTERVSVSTHPIPTFSQETYGDIQRILDYLWHDEQQDYRANDSKKADHIFLLLSQVKSWLDRVAGQKKVYTVIGLWSDRGRAFHEEVFADSVAEAAHAVKEGLACSLRGSMTYHQEDYDNFRVIAVLEGGHGSTYCESAHGNGTEHYVTAR